MRVDDRYLDEFHNQGFTIVPDFLTAGEVAAARDELWAIYPQPAEYFADPTAHPAFQRSQFAGLRELPFASLSLNLLTVHPDLVDVVQRLLTTQDVRLYKGELWAKYGSSIDYDQDHHRDFGNHTLVVPRPDRLGRSITTFVYLCDVDESNGATAVVPVEHSRSIPLGVSRLGSGEFRDREVRASAPAGSLLIYSTEIFHRGTAFADPTASRFMLLADFRAADAPWIQKQAFGNHGDRPEMAALVTFATAAQRTVLGIPAPGNPYWDAQTLADMAIRYPGIDLTGYGPTG